MPAAAAAPARPGIDAPTREYIEGLINYSYKRDVADTVYGRFAWRKLSNAGESASRVLAGGSTVVAFAAGVYGIDSLSFVAGALGTLGLVCMTLSGYAARESRERTDQLNAVLEHVGVAAVPDLVVMGEADDDDDHHADATGLRRP